MVVRKAIIHPKAREALRTFPPEVKRELGDAIWDLQQGKRLSMPLSRPMPSVAVGAEELRVRDSAGIYRAFYFLKSTQGILVFHAFVKKTPQTPLQEIRLGQRRLREMLYEKD
jgi:phage-related protein